MSEHIVYVAPSKTESEILAPAAPPPQAPAPLTHEDIQAVDAAFRSSPDPDLAAGLLTLWLNMPFALELAREHFPGRDDITQPEPEDTPDE
jgi:hypothetical protein